MTGPGRSERQSRSAPPKAHQEDRPSWAWLGSWAVLLIAAVFILVLGGGYAGIAALQAKVALQVAAVVILGGWLLVAIARPAWLPDSPLLVPVLTAVAGYTLSAMLSQRPRLSLEPTLGGLGFALTFLFLTRLLSQPWFRRRVAILVVTLAAGAAAAYCVLVVSTWVEWWLLVGRLAVPPLRPGWAGLTFGTPNLVATVLLLTGPLAVVLVGGENFRRWRTLAFAALLLTAFFLTGSRGAFLGLSFGFVVLCAALLDKGRLRSVGTLARSLARRRRGMLIWIGALAVAAVLLVPGVAHRFSQGGDSVRIDLWRTALALFQDHPVTGIGPGTWVQLKVTANAALTPNPIFSHAHNLYIQALAELGLVGCLAAGFLVFAVMRRILAARRYGGHASRLAAYAALLTIPAFAGQALVDTLVNMPTVCLLVIGLVAWVDSGLSIDTGYGFSTQETGRSRRWGRLAAAASFIAIVASVPTLARIDLAWLHDDEGNSAAERGDWPSALARFDEARALDPDLTLYSLQAAGALARLDRTAEAQVLAARAVDADPVAMNQIGLAALDAQLGDVDGALQRARLAVSLGFKESTVALNAGIIGEGAGELDFALDQFANAVAWNPPLARIAFWYSPDRLVDRELVIDAAVARSDPLEGALIRAYAGDADDAIHLLDEQAPSHTRELYLAATTWLAGDAPRAQLMLASMLEANPLDWEAAAWLARIARLSGDDLTSIRYARWAEIVQYDAAHGVIFETSAVPPSADAEHAGLPELAYPAGVYARPISPFFPMPELVLIGIR